VDCAVLRASPATANDQKSPVAAVFEYSLSAAAPDPLRDAGSGEHSTAIGRPGYLFGHKSPYATLAQ